MSPWKENAIRLKIRIRGPPDPLRRVTEGCDASPPVFHAGVARGLCFALEMMLSRTSLSRVRFISITQSHTLPTTMKQPRKVGILTAGGLAPCLSTAIGGLIERYSEIAPDVEIICYKSGYKGLLLGDSFKVTHETIGGDDTNTAAADLAAFLAKHNYPLIVIGLPKTVDNDVYPIRQSLGAYTAAEYGAMFFSHVVNERSANPRMLIVHEVMGRSCGWLTAYTAKMYRESLCECAFLPELGATKANYDIHGIYIPEMAIDIPAEAKRLKAIMDKNDNVNLFVSEGAGVASIVAQMEKDGQEVPRDAFGHVKLDAVNPGAYFAKQFAAMIGAEKTLVQKSGYFARASASNVEDLRLIKSCVDTAVECAFAGVSGVIGHDEDKGDVLRAIEFPRIKGGKPFNTELPWFEAMLKDIGQEKGAKASAAH
jgi:pyrophosphate--fructose-6-phosphate 1-phosphotransferase